MSQLPHIDDFVAGILGAWPQPLRDDRAYIKPAPPIDEMASWAIFGAARHWSKQTNREPVRAYAQRIAPRLLAMLDERLAAPSTL